jgi:hypothetical protein
MYNFFLKVPKFSPVVVAVEDESGGLYGILLGVTIREMKGLVGYLSSRTVIYGGPLVNPDSAERKEILRMILEGLINEVKNHSIFIQFRNFYYQEEKMAAFEDADFHLRDRLNLIVDTSSIELVKSKMSISRLRQVKKGIGHGAKCIEPQNLDQMRKFYDILFYLYKFKVKKPLPSWDFFKQFYYESKEGRLGIIRLVEYQGKIIGGILAPVTPGKTIYEWYVCGLDQEYKEDYPSVLATWAALEYAVNNDIPQFDFMGVGIPERKYGVREFKSRFGGEMVNFGRFARINNRFFYAISEAGFNILALLKKI